MSRSRKKPYVCDYSRNGTKFYKKLASKTVRKYSDHISNGNLFKKLYSSYNIKDWFSYIPDKSEAYRK